MPSKPISNWLDREKRKSIVKDVQRYTRVRSQAKKKLSPESRKKLAEHIKVHSKRPHAGQGLRKARGIPLYPFHLT